MPLYYCFMNEKKMNFIMKNTTNEKNLYEKLRKLVKFPEKKLF